MQSVCGTGAQRTYSLRAGAGWVQMAVALCSVMIGHFSKSVVELRKSNFESV